ncbi:MAG: hypothetical protein JWM21_1422 [Acidobacteria bacterium]|nr:hypothetical protein [Acidobacteriota bacterium]
MLSLKPTYKSAWLFIGIGVLIISVGVIRSTVRRVTHKADRANPGLANTEARHRLAVLPRIILWAWERPEKLDFIDTDRTGVAYLAKTIYLRNETVVSRPRLQPLSVRPGTVLTAVARIETDRFAVPSLSHSQIDSAAKEISGLAQLPNITAVQIDFDARVSERSFYADLLTAVRKALPSTTTLSITALVSWCQGDDWIDKLPVDEAVPMLFRMGVDRRQILSNLDSGEGFQAPLCGQSAGVSVDETLTDAPASERIYVFNPDSWTPDSVAKVMEKYQR